MKKAKEQITISVIIGSTRPGRFSDPGGDRWPGGPGRQARDHPARSSTIAKQHARSRRMCPF